MEYYRIAGLSVAMESFGKTVDQAKPYLGEAVGEPDIVIRSNWQRLKEKQPEISDESCEYLSTGASFYRQLIKFNGIMIHSSAVVVDGKAYLFTAPCGTGKSTHTALWLREFGDRAVILNDDKPAVRLEDGVFYAYGTPWSGKTNQNLNRRVPIGGICILARGEKNEISRVTGKTAIFGLLSQTVRPKNEVFMNKVLDLLSRLIDTVPIWQLFCTMDLEAARVSYEAMSSASQKNLTGGIHYEA